MVRGASGDEWGELIGGKGTIGLQAAVPKRPHTRSLTLTLLYDFNSNRNVALSFSKYIFDVMYRGSTVVKVLRYKSEGH